MLQMLGAFAEFERGMIRERCAAGRAAAVARGSRFGRKRCYDYPSMVRLRAEGLSFRQIAVRVGCSHATAVKAVARVFGGMTPESVDKGQPSSIDVDEPAYRTRCDGDRGPGQSGDHVDREYLGPATTDC